LLASGVDLFEVDTPVVSVDDPEAPADEVGGVHDLAVTVLGSQEAEQSVAHGLVNGSLRVPAAAEQHLVASPQGPGT
jgi:hypothetical protein